MTDAPERIWAEAWWGERKHHRHHDAGDTDCEFTETEYILFDVHKALLAAERRKALEEAAAHLEGTADRTAEAMKLTEQWEHSVRVALAHSEKILRRVAAAIRALMEKEQEE